MSTRASHRRSGRDAGRARPASRYQGKVAEGKLTFVGPARFQYELDDEGKVKINPDGSVSVAWWIRDENGAWQPWMTNTFTRV